MKQLLEAAIKAEAPHDALRVLTARCRAVGIDAFLAAPIEGDITAWEPGPLDPNPRAWTMAGRGCAQRFDGRGVKRFEDLERSVSIALRDAREFRDEDLDAATLRVFGGGAFHVDGCDELWSLFGDASFIVPRWSYGESGSDAFLRVTLTATDLDRVESVRAEIDRVVSAFENQSNLAEKITNLTIGGGRIEETSTSAWSELVTQALLEIDAHRLEKVVLARRTHIVPNEALDARTVLTRLREGNPRAARFALGRGRRTFLGATPERLCSVRGTTIATEAIAGTVARTTDNDAVDAEELLRSEKNRREHAHTVAGIVAVLESLHATVTRDEIPHVRSLSRVHHLCTPITATLPSRVHALRVLSALHPTPAVCGTPSSAASRWIEEHETFARGWYASPVGWFDGVGDGVFAVAIRSALVETNEAWLYAGAGIVAGSEPIAEYAETAVKQRTVLSALGMST